MHVLRDARFSAGYAYAEGVVVVIIIILAFLFLVFLFFLLTPLINRGICFRSTQRKRKRHFIASLRFILRVDPFFSFFIFKSLFSLAGTRIKQKPRPDGLDIQNSHLRLCPPAASTSAPKSPPNVPCRQRRWAIIRIEAQMSFSRWCLVSVRW